MPWLEDLLQQHQEVFKPDLSILKEVDTKLFINLEAKPAFFKAQSIPFALLEKVELSFVRPLWSQLRGVREKLEDWKGLCPSGSEACLQIKENSEKTTAGE